MQGYVRKKNRFKMKKKSSYNNNAHQKETGVEKEKEWLH